MKLTTGQSTANTAKIFFHVMKELFFVKTLPAKLWAFNRHKIKTKNVSVYAARHWINFIINR